MEHNEIPKISETVTVVITTFNDAEFLQEALASIQAQEYPPAEIIVVDDGSDTSPAALVGSFPGAVLLRKKNGGLSSARNFGLNHASSEFITFLDADDRLEPSAVASGLACFREHPEAVMVFGGHRRIEADGTRLPPDMYQAVGVDSYADLLRGNCIGMHATVMYRREVLLGAGGFEESLRRCEDYDLYLRLARDHCIASHPTIVAEYRWHGGNMSRDTGQMLQAVLAVHDRHRQQVASRRVAWLAGRRNWKAWYATGQQTYWGGGRKSLGQRLREFTRSFARRCLVRLRDACPPALIPQSYRGWPPAKGKIDFGQLGTTRPVSLDFGWDRGTPIDRYYVDNFLTRCAGDIAGRVLEIGDDAYSRRFGGVKITRQDVLHVDPQNRSATLIGDLTHPGVLPEGAFDCIVLTQTLQLIFELEQAATQLYSALRPGGVLLLTVPGISQIDRQEWSGRWCWGFTSASIQKLFERDFGVDTLDIEAHGNVFAAIAFLSGAAVEEVDRSKLDVEDPAYPVLITLRAQKH